MKMLGAVLLACVASLAVGITEKKLTPEEQTILDAVNKATYETLHYTYDIWAWKAKAIIDNRGWRYTYPRLLEVPGVTDYVLDLVLKGATATCKPRPPQGGRYSGVDFTDAEAQRVLDAANKASFSGLMKVGDIYRSKVVNVFKARPVCSMDHLQNLLHSATTPLTLLKKLTDVDRLCYDNSDCTTGPKRCEGVEELVGFGKCMTKQMPMGVKCGGELACPSSDYVCWESMGECVDSWMGGTYIPALNREVVSIPAQGTAPVESFFAVFGLATAPQDVYLTIDTSGVTDPTGLKIVLRCPAGDEATYYGGKGPLPTGELPMSNPGDGSANGEWTIIVSNLGTAAGKVTLKTLRMVSRWD